MIFDLIDRVLTAMIKPFVVLLSLFVALAMVFGIFARSVLNTPLLGLEELVLFSVIWLYMLGAALASQERTHLTADFVHILTDNKQVHQSIRVAASIISMVMAIVFLIWSYDLLAWGLAKRQSTPVFQLPLYASQGSLFVCSLLFVFYALRDVINDVKSLREDKR